MGHFEPMRAHSDAVCHSHDHDLPDGDRVCRIEQPVYFDSFHIELCGARRGKRDGLQHVQADRRGGHGESKCAAGPVPAVVSDHWNDHTGAGTVPDAASAAAGFKRTARGNQSLPAVWNLSGKRSDRLLPVLLSGIPVHGGSAGRHHQCHRDGNKPLGRPDSIGDPADDARLLSVRNHSSGGHLRESLYRICTFPQVLSSISL